jgi:Flp pilus assembly protein protease CpaA
MFLLLIFAALFFTISDLRTHKISNNSLLISLALFGVASHLQGNALYFQSFLVALVLGFVAHQVGVGAGDGKLFSLLAIFYLPFELESWRSFVISFSLFSMVLVIIHLIRRVPISQPIALAPAICGAFIWCAR